MSAASARAGANSNRSRSLRFRKGIADYLRGKGVAVTDCWARGPIGGAPRTEGANADLHLDDDWAVTVTARNDIRLTEVAGRAERAAEAAGQSRWAAIARRTGHPDPAATWVILTLDTFAELVSQ